MSTSQVPLNDKNAPTVVSATAEADKLNVPRKVEHGSRSVINEKLINDPFPLFPSAPKKERRWCVWKYVWNGKDFTKQPFASLTRWMRWKSPENWLTYEEACTIYLKHRDDNPTLEKPTAGDKVAGIGIFANGKEAFIDFDKCCNHEGVLEPWAEEAVRDVGSYAEYSPSGTGLHAFALGTVDKSEKVNGCEIYAKGRFFTVTGSPVPNCPAYEFRPYTGLSQFRKRIFNNKLRPYQLHKAGSGEESVDERVETAAAARLFEAYVVHCEPEEMFGLEIEIPQGERHNTLNSIAGWLHDGERDEEDIFEILQRLYDEYCLGEEMSSDELRSIAWWVVQKPPCQIEPRDLPCYSIGEWIFDSKESLEKWKDEILKNIESGTLKEDMLHSKEAVIVIALEKDEARRELLIKKLAVARGVTESTVFVEVTASTNVVIIVRQGYLIENVTACEQILNSSKKYYQRAGELVSPALAKDVEKDSGAIRHGESVVTQIATVPSIRWGHAQNAKFIKWDGRKNKYVPADPPREYAEQIIDRVRTSPREVPYPVLDMVVNTPVLLSDGTVLTDGYKNGVLVMSNREYPAVPEHPTREDAIAALKKFAAIYHKFPFKKTDGSQRWNDTPSYSSVLAGNLSLVARPALPTVPLFSVSAPTRGTGKTKIAEAAGGAMLGHKPTAVTFGGPEEFEKLLIPLLRKQDRIILIDNVSVPLRGDKLNSVLTASSHRGRVLGQSEDIQLLNRAVFFTSGNNLQIEGDLTRRTLQITLDAGIENPEEQRFDFEPVERALDLHQELVIAALTAVRAYIVAGRPEVLDRALLGSFEAWDRLICGTLVWCGYADPILTRKDVAEHDPEREVYLTILETWYRIYRSTPVSVVDISKADTDLKRYLSNGKGEFNTKSAGWTINRLRNRPIGGYRLVAAPGTRKHRVEALDPNVYVSEKET
jgi:hypothetical protein